MIDSLSLYGFFGSQNITKSSLAGYGLTASDFQSADTNGDGVLSADEISASTNVSNAIQSQMNAKTQGAQQQPQPPQPPQGAEQSQTLGKNISYVA